MLKALMGASLMIPLRFWRHFVQNIFFPFEAGLQLITLAKPYLIGMIIRTLRFLPAEILSG